ncbi:MAG: hypothetical protein WB919_01065 [Candidatus Sulfotelmatobacter sp.]
MGTRCSVLFAFAGAISLAVGTGYAQDSPSLGDLARQQRQQKEQAKTAAGKDAKPAKVITNEEIPGHAALAAGSVTSGQEEETAQAESSSGAKQPAEHLPAENWKSQILAQKNQIAGLQSQIAQLDESIRFAPANCVANCVSWNEHQKQKQDQVERMQAQLDDQKKQLDEMQESARKQGYSSAVYDP